MRKTAKKEKLRILGQFSIIPVCPIIFHTPCWKVSRQWQTYSASSYFSCPMDCRGIAFISGAAPDALFPVLPEARRKANADYALSSPLSIPPAAELHSFFPADSVPLFPPSHRTPLPAGKAFLFSHGSTAAENPANPASSPSGSPSRESGTSSHKIPCRRQSCASACSLLRTGLNGIKTEFSER